MPTMGLEKTASVATTLVLGSAAGWWSGSAKSRFVIGGRGGALASSSRVAVTTSASFVVLSSAWWFPGPNADVAPFLCGRFWAALRSLFPGWRWQGKCRSARRTSRCRSVVVACRCGGGFRLDQCSGRIDHVFRPSICGIAEGDCAFPRAVGPGSTSGWVLELVL